MLSLALKDTREHHPHPWPRVPNPETLWPGPDLSGHTSVLYLPETVGHGELVSPPHLISPHPAPQALALPLGFISILLQLCNNFTPTYAHPLGGGRMHTLISSHSGSLTHLDASFFP